MLEFKPVKVPKKHEASDIATFIENTDQFFANKHVLYCWNGSYYEKDINERLKLFVEHFCIHVERTYRDSISVEVYKILCNRHQIDEPVRYPDIIPFPNGWFDISTKKLRKPNPGMFITYRFPFNYDAGAECPRFIKFLEEVLPDKNDRANLCRFLCYCFTQRINLQKSLILWGRGSNGKTIIISLLSIIFRDICTSIPMQNLGDRFNKVQFMGKLINIYDDLGNNALKDDGYIKSAITADILSGEFKGKDPITYINTCKFIFTSNELPSPNPNATEGFYRRFMIIPFKQKFEAERADIYLLEKLKSEICGIISYLLNFSDDIDRIFTLNHNRTKKDWNRYSNSVLSFLEEKVVLEDSESVLSADLYEAYRKFVRIGDLNPISKNGFGRIIAAQGISKIQIQGMWYYNGIRLKQMEEIINDIVDTTGPPSR